MKRCLTTEMVSKLEVKERNRTHLQINARTVSAEDPGDAVMIFPQEGDFP